jgi:NTP pyrophosphatase (non-canonical NTP hydrolase)
MKIRDCKINSEFTTLTEKAKVIEQLQTAFDVYQNEHFPVRSPQFFCLELNGEAGELANFEKKLWKGKKLDEAHLADEAADVLIALFNYANSRSIDLSKALLEKLNVIESKRLLLAEKGESY